MYHESTLTSQNSFINLLIIQSKMCSSDSDSSSSLSSISLEKLNISNDQYYKLAGPHLKPKPQQNPTDDPDLPKYGSNTIKHSLPAYDLWRAFFPTFLSQEKYRNFHRPKLRHFSTGPQARSRYRKIKAQPVKSLSRHIYIFQKRLRNRVIDAINRGLTREQIIDKFLLIKRASDLTAKVGELILFEYVEEYPPVLSQIGMASNVKIIKQPGQCSISNTAKKKIAQQISGYTPSEVPTINNYGTSNQSYSAHSFGFEQTLSINNRTLPNRTKQQIYFNELKPGSKLQVIENNLYRAPIYQHEFPSTDFLIIRTRIGLYIRPILTIFTVGQTMPLVAVPRPIESNINKFFSDLSNIYIDKLFRQSDSDPPSIDLNNVLRLFPNYPRQTFVKRLWKKGVQLKIFGDEKLFFRGTSTYGKSSLSEHRSSLTPERYCLNMASQVARQRLMELNYTDSMINPDGDAEIETEVLAAPWLTTKAVIDAIAGRCYLDLKKHLIDPTGPQREGFSCVPWVKSPTECEQLKERALQAKSSQRPSNGNISLSIQANPHKFKITREKVERLAIYNREAQLVSEIQDNVLRSREELSSDENDSDEVDDENALDSSFDTQLKDLGNLVMEHKTSSQIDYEKEEEERRELIRQFGDTAAQQNKQTPPCDNAEASTISVPSLHGKVLRIIRTYDTPEGPIQRTEFVREPKIIALYLKRKGASLNIDETNQNGCFMSKDKFFVKKKLPSRRASISLGPSELCRADGIVLTISKKVLNNRAMRNLRKKQSQSFNG